MGKHFSSAITDKLFEERKREGKKNAGGSQNRKEKRERSRGGDGNRHSHGATNEVPANNEGGGGISAGESSTSEKTATFGQP